MSLIHGKNLIISVDDVSIAAAKSCDVQIHAATVQVSSLTDGTWEHNEVGRKSWSITTNMLVIESDRYDIAIISRALLVGQKVTLKVSVNNNQLDVLSGTAVCTAFRVTGTMGNLVQGSFAFKGDGPLE